MESTTRLSGFLLILFLVFALVFSDFQFCMNGPQRIKDGECPGGLIMAKTLSSPCILVGRDSGYSSSKAELRTGHCTGKIESKYIENTSPKTIESANKDEDESLFQEVVFTSVASAGDAGVAVTDRENCIKSCLKDWNDPKMDLPPEEAEYDFGIPPPPTNTIKEQQIITQDLYTYMNFDYHPKRNHNKDMRMFRVLQEALKVLEKHCRFPFVNKVFIDHIYAALHFVVINTGSRALINDLGEREYSLIRDALERCMKGPAKLDIKGTSCGSSHRINTIDGKPYRLDGKAWRWGKFDLMIEAAWMAIEFVHGYCFREYSQDLNFQHLLVKAMDALFSNKVQIRWIYPTKTKDDAFIENMVGVRDVNATMRNIDFCVVASRSLSPYNGRLGRPFEKQPGTFPSTNVGMTGSSHTNTGPTGWPNNDMNDYWAKYQATGGIRAVLKKDIGLCANTAAELEAYKKDTVKPSCPKGVASNEVTGPGSTYYDY